MDSATLHEEIYRVELSTATISAITDKIIDQVKAWQSRPLESIYPFVKWENLSVYFKYPPEIRKVIYTTNIIESVHRQFRKLTA